MDNKNKAIAESEKCESKMDIATRLINSLASENDRWEQGIIDLDTKLELLPGDVLLSASFVSYIGPFSKKFRQDIVNNYFIKFMKDNNIPRQSDGDALGLLCNDAIVAGWNNQKLPSDRVSTENGAILTNSARWSLIVDPQLQGITWLREKESSNNLQITRLANKNMSKVVEKSIEQGFSCLIENLQESVDAVLAPVIARTVSKRGGSKIMKLGDKELIYNANFKLLLHTKLSNPHFPPEIQAECTIINFAVTEDGLEDQLLSLVVKLERPDLASNKENLIKQQNEYKIKLKELEEGLLKSLSEAEGDILENIELVENLEESKRVSTDITEKSEIAKITFDKILEASEG